MTIVSEVSHVWYRLVSEFSSYEKRPPDLSTLLVALQLRGMVIHDRFSALFRNTQHASFCNSISYSRGCMVSEQGAYASIHCYLGVPLCHRIENDA